MDLTYFIQNKNDLEPALKSGIYCVQQKHLPTQFQAFRCGLAGRPKDSATSVTTNEGNFQARFAMYLSAGWLPTDGIVHAVLTVPRRAQLGFAERVMPEQVEGDNREPYQLLHMGKSLVAVREQQYHQLLVRYGMERLGMPGTEESRRRGEFFRGPLSTVLRSLKEIGTGDLWTFKSNTSYEKVELRRRGIKPIEPEQVALRQSPRLYGVSPLLAQLLTEGDQVTTQAVAKLKDVVVVHPTPAIRKSPQLANEEPITIAMTPAQLARQKRRDKTTNAALAQIAQIRRSPRLAAL